MTKKLSDNEIKTTYKMIDSHDDKYLRQHGVKMPRLTSTEGFTKDALVLIYPAQDYPKTRTVSKTELTE